MNNYLIPQMSSIYQLYNPEYPASRERDFPALRSIAEFLADMGKLGDAYDRSEDILSVWTQVCIYVSKDRFYAQKSLKTISNHIQEIVQKIKDGDKTAKQSISNATLARKINERNSKR